MPARLMSAGAVVLSDSEARALEATLRARIAGEIDFGPGARALYATDASNYRQTPLGVVWPRTTDDVIETVRTCRESARGHLDDVFEALARELRQDVPIIVLEPSCFAVFRDEASNLSGDSAIAKALAERAVLFDAFVRPHFERGELPPLPGNALVHLHCHQQALAGRDATADTLRVAQLNARILDAGCCGMAGAFGFDKHHYRVSMDVGERVLLPAVRSAPAETIIIADGFSCREQIRHATGRRAYHFAEAVCRSLGECAERRELRSNRR